MPFSETEEGKRRASQTTDEIQQFAQGIIDKSLEKEGVPEDIKISATVRSDYKITDAMGVFSPKRREFKFNEICYLGGYYDIEHTAGHEMKHLKRKILIASLPDEEREGIIKKYFTDLIMDGEYGEVAVFEDDETVGTLIPPYLNKPMRKEFADFADEYLYQTEKSYSDDELRAMAAPMVDNYPEFAEDNECKTKEEAIDFLAGYAKAINGRYKNCKRVTVDLLNKRNLNLKREMTPEEKELARTYCLSAVELTEANFLDRHNGENKFLERYRYTEEELGVDRSALEGIIQSLRDELNALRQNPNYDKCKEAEIIDKINRYSLQTEFREKGRETLLAQKRANSTRNPIDQIRADSLREETSDLIESAKYFGYNEHLDEGEPTGFIYEET